MVQVQAEAGPIRGEIGIKEELSQDRELLSNSLEKGGEGRVAFIDPRRANRFAAGEHLLDLLGFDVEMGGPALLVRVAHFKVDAIVNSAVNAAVNSVKDKPSK